MASYAMDFARSRRRSDRADDLTAEMLAADFGGSPMSDVEFGGFFVQLVTAGNDTTKGMLSSGLLTLLRHPDQLARLRRPHPAPGAVEEIVRYDNPLHYFRRTALVDTELPGTRIAAGDKVAMYYTSANRDERVFADPQTFDIGRKPNPHLSFGMGGHFCLGAHLARLEGRVFFAELLDAFGTDRPDRRAGAGALEPQQLAQDAADPVGRLRPAGIQSKVSGSGPRRPASPLSSPVSSSIWSSLSSKSKMSMFSLIRCGVEDLGNTISPRSMCQRSTTWAGSWPPSGRSGRPPDRRARRPGRSATTPR